MCVCVYMYVGVRVCVFEKEKEGVCIRRLISKERERNSGIMFCKKNKIKT